MADDQRDETATIDIRMSVVFHKNRVIKAPSVLHFMVINKWTSEEVRRYCNERGWSVTRREE